MAVTLNRGRSEQLHLQKFKDKEAEHSNDQTQKRVVVPVVYYLSRNGQLEHPHFMEVPLSSSHGLYLRDVIHRLNLLRGKSMASHYSWSSKRSYKNGYVWHDLSEDDFIHPVHGGEYVLKGSELLPSEPNSSSAISKLSEITWSSSSSSAKNSGDSENPRNHEKNRRRNQSWGAIDLHEYKVYKSESTHELAGKAGADASTQTDEKRRRSSKKSVVIKEEPEQIDKEEEITTTNTTTELSREEISPPPSDSSPETLETLMKADGRILLPATLSSSSSTSLPAGVNQTVGGCPSGRMRASSVLMSLISCGSLSFRDCGVAAVKDHGFHQ
ncbi:Protein UPSTREAM OF FLC [Bienertia sinuspersici]